MIHRTHALLIAFFTFLSVSAARAELSPLAYGQLLNGAQEVYRLRVEKVDLTSALDKSGFLHFVCEAKILVVERSKAGRQVGDMIRFSSYSVPREVRQSGIAGPQVPPLISKGWQGIVYLNPPKQGDVLQLAAYGRSFVEEYGGTPTPRNISQTTNNSDLLGVTTRPVAEGGLFIVSTHPGSLADDMGLRAGDRLIRVNTRAVSAPSDVKAALAMDSHHVTVTVSRGQKPLEISLAR